MAAQSTAIPPSAAQELVSAIWCCVQEGRAVVDDVHGAPIAGLEHYGDLLDLRRPVLLSTLGRRLVATLPAGPLDMEAEARALVGDAPAEEGRAAGRAAARRHQRLVKATGLIAQHVAEARGRAERRAGPSTAEPTPRVGANSPVLAARAAQRVRSGSRQPRRPASSSAASGPQEPRG